MEWKKLGILTLGTIAIVSSNIGCNLATQKTLQEMEKAAILDVGGDYISIYKKYADYIIENNGGKNDEFVGRVRGFVQKL